MTDTQAGPPETALFEVAAVVARACAASGKWRALRPATRAEMLRAVASQLDEATDELVALAGSETHLSEARLTGELLRTTFQLRFLAGVAEDGDCFQVAIDTPDENWPPGPRPDLRRILRPIGPVAVFAASNFPFAFSVAGGDTASALAAGCTVVLKAHPGHARLSVRCAEIVVDALREAGAPEGTFSLIAGDEAGRSLIAQPGIAAVAFTGSQKVGRLLFDLAVGRPKPIPFYGELGSVNPVFVTERAAAARIEDIAKGYVASFTLGAGQFCTQPGVLLLPAGRLDEDKLRDLVEAQPPARLLNDRIDAGFGTGLESLQAHPDLSVIAKGVRQPDGNWSPTLLRTSVDRLVAHAEELVQECFGPVSLVVEYDDEAQLLQVARLLEGQLTATVHAEAEDGIVPELLEELAERAGRVVWNGWPTGVSVTWAMQHGGPYPATTSPLHTSVGAAAVARFLRPVTYQGVPDHFLPEGLREGNPLKLPRRVEGNYEPA